MKSLALKNYRLCLAGAIGVVAITLHFSSRLTRATKDWTRQNEVVLEDVGEVLSVEQAGEIDRSCAFGDGCNSSLTLQVEGSNGTGELRFSNVFFDNGQLYGAGAQWDWQDQSTTIHIESGLSAAEYYSLQNYLTILDERLASKPFREFNYQRAMINWVLGNKAQAYEDIRVAIGIREDSKLSIEARNPNLYEPPREEYRVLALFQTFDGDYASALETAELLVASHEENGRELENDRELANDYVLRWIVQTESGNQEEADRVLEEACNTLLDKSSEDDADR